MDDEDIEAMGEQVGAGMASGILVTPIEVIDVLEMQLAEREACAAIADRYAHSPEGVAIAAKIRARK